MPKAAKSLLPVPTFLALALVAGLTLGSVPAGAAFPGANGRIACSAALHSPLGQPTPLPGGQSRLELFDIFPDVTGERRLTFNTNSDFNPRYSADGSKIAFIKDNHVWTINADATNETGPLTTLGANAFPGWTPDGNQIVFQTSRDGNFEVYRMNADGSNQVNLTNNATPGANSDSQPAVSPDGTRIAFQSNRLGNANIHIMNIDGSNVTALTGGSPAEESAPVWSPDGQQIAFQSDRAVFPRPGVARNLEIYRTNANGTGTPTRLTFVDYDPAGGTTTSNLTGFDLNPAWSPDGTRIVFHSGRAAEFRDSGSAGIIGQWEAYHMDAVNGEGPGGHVIRLTNRPGNDERCDWQAVRPAQAPAQVQYRFNYPGPGGGGTLAFANCPSASRNLVLGTNGNDARTGTAVGDRIFTGTGNDTVDGLAGNDCIDLGAGIDRGVGGSGNDLVLGGTGVDRVSGSSGNDTLRGNDGNDRVGGGAGNDRLHGLAGRDRVSGDSGRDRINGGSAGDRIAGGGSADRIAGDQGSDRISGNSGNDRINGNSGNDRISGGSGRDRIRAGSGRDRIRAGSGRDRISVRGGGVDRVNCGSGTDRVSADGSDVVSGNCENVTRSGAGAATASQVGSLGLPALAAGALLLLVGGRRRAVD